MAPTAAEGRSWSMTEQICIIAHKFEPQRPREAIPGRLICVGCQGHLRNQISDLPGLHEELTEELARQWSEVVTNDNWPLSIPEKALPINPDVADLRSEMEALLMSYGRQVAEELDTDWPPTGITNITGWLLKRLDIAARQAWVADMIDGVNQLTKDANKLIDTRRRSMAFLGPCEANGDCEGRLFVEVQRIIGEKSDIMPATVTCPECGNEHDTEQRVAWAQKQREDIGNAREVAARAGVKWSLVRKWHERGKLTKVGRSETGAPLFRVSEVEALRDRQAA